MSQAAITRHRWTRKEYEHMVAAGIFDPQARLELVDGEIFSMTPQGSFHATAIGLTEQVLRSIFTSGYYVRVQMPLALDDASEPEPDIAIVIGNPRDYRDAHPDKAVLVVEVAETTLSFDRGEKKTLYARNGIFEYWIINLVDNQLEVYRKPRENDYNFKTILRRGESISPLALASQPTQIADLLP